MTTKFFKFFVLMVAASLFVFQGVAQPRLPEGYFWKKLPNGLEVVGD